MRPARDIVDPDTHGRGATAQFPGARFFGAYDRLLDAAGLVPGLAVAAMALGVAVDVTLRNLSLGSLPWMLEVVEYALYALTLIGTASVLRAGRHVRIDLIASLFGPRGKVASELLAALIMAAITAILFTYGLKAMLLAFDRGAMLRQYFNVPEWVPLLLLPVAWLLVLIECARHILICLTDLRAIAPSGRPATGPH